VGHEEVGRARHEPAVLPRPGVRADGRDRPRRALGGPVLLQPTRGVPRSRRDRGDGRLHRRSGREHGTALPARRRPLRADGLGPRRRIADDGPRPRDRDLLEPGAPGRRQRDRRRHLCDDRRVAGDLGDPRRARRQQRPLRGDPTRGDLRHGPRRAARARSDGRGHDPVEPLGRGRVPRRRAARSDALDRRGAGRRRRRGDGHPRTREGRLRTDRRRAADRGRSPCRRPRRRGLGHARRGDQAHRRPLRTRRRDRPGRRPGGRHDRLGGVVLGEGPAEHHRRRRGLRAPPRRERRAGRVPRRDADHVGPVRVLDDHRHRPDLHRSAGDRSDARFQPHDLLQRERGVRDGLRPDAHHRPDAHRADGIRRPHPGDGPGGGARGEPHGDARGAAHRPVGRLRRLGLVRHQRVRRRVPLRLRRRHERTRPVTEDDPPLRRPRHVPGRPDRDRRRGRDRPNHAIRHGGEPTATGDLRTRRDGSRDGPAAPVRRRRGDRPGRRHRRLRVGPRGRPDGHRGVAHSRVRRPRRLHGRTHRDRRRRRRHDQPEDRVRPGGERTAEPDLRRRDRIRRRGHVRRDRRDRPRRRDHRVRLGLRRRRDPDGGDGHARLRGERDLRGRTDGGRRRPRGGGPHPDRRGRRRRWNADRDDVDVLRDD